jgi:hypothetical protein
MSKQTRPTAKKSQPLSRQNPNSGTGSQFKPRTLDGAKPSTGKRTPAKKPQGPNLTLIIGIVVAVVVSVIALLIIAPWNSTTTIVSTDPGLSPILVGPDPIAKIEQFAEEGRNHIAAGTKTNYQTNPPTSGDHYPTWSNYGIFKNPLPDGLVVHNMEHGGVIIYYDCPQGCPATVSALSGYALKYSPEAFTGIILQPRDGLPNGARLALTAWRNRLLLRSLDTDKINDFLKQRFNKGPEADPNTVPFN